ncbi:uncharacterized protein LOC126482071 [Schistocerca serialis cubense]|uniref:uncharacterized protein LOC126482071 n=1 Tax=Schistocerca serialis cubense TaxID=2023355 RepID=UPI00214E59AB|nr:uncharacterized protein LOC126482071 [Schistocerca serialis cubense]
MADTLREDTTVTKQQPKGGIRYTSTSLYTRLMTAIYIRAGSRRRLGGSEACRSGAAGLDLRPRGGLDPLTGCPLPNLIPARPSAGGVPALQALQPACCAPWSVPGHQSVHTTPPPPPPPPPPPRGTPPRGLHALVGNRDAPAPLCGSRACPVAHRAVSA